MPVMFSAQPCCDIDCKDVRVPVIESCMFQECLMDKMEDIDLGHGYSVEL